MNDVQPIKPDVPLVAVSPPSVATARSDDPDAAQTLLSGLGAGPFALVLLFGEEGQKLGGVTARLSSLLGPGCLTLASSSAGGFTSEGYLDGDIVAIGLPASGFRADAVWLSDLRQHKALDWMMSLRELAEKFPERQDRSRFGLLLVDGASGCEELVAATVDATLPDVLVLGGSAGDGLRFGQTWLVMNGDARIESALFCMIETEHAVKEVIFDHFVPFGSRMVVTDADPDKRLIREINAEPAASEYARLIGLKDAQLEPRDFAENPLLERSGGRHFVRAIRGVTPDGELSLMSSIEVGAILTLGRSESLTEGLRRQMEQIGPVQLVLGFDCILRRIAVEEAGEQDTVRELCRDFRIAGFNTYGEQHGGIHVNQTFVGLAVLSPKDTDKDAS